jgi:tryptophan 7-halogenase
MGQGVFPESHHRATRIPGTESLQHTLSQIRANVAANFAQLPDHQAFIERYCSSAGGAPR